MLLGFSNKKLWYVSRSIKDLLRNFKGKYFPRPRVQKKYKYINK